MIKVSDFKFLGSSINTVRRILRILLPIFKDFPIISLCVLFLTLFSGFFPVVNLWISKHLIDQIVNYLSAPDSSREIGDVVYWVILQASSATCSIVIFQVNEYLSQKLSQQITVKMEHDIFTHCLKMDLEFFESPATKDLLFRTRNQSAKASNSIFVSCISLARIIVTALMSFAILFQFSPLLSTIALCVAIPNMMVNLSLALDYYNLSYQRTERIRKANYYSTLMDDRIYVRDSLLFRLREYFLDQWSCLRNLQLKEDLKIQGKTRRIQMWMGLFQQLVHAGAYLYIIDRIVKNSGTYGAIMMNVGLFANAQGQIRGIAGNLVELYKSSVFLSDYMNLKQMDSKIEKKMPGISLNGHIESIQFIDVCFRYPNSQREALKSVSFKIKAGECVCFTGPNGAGKTTIIKLLTRLYEPDSGKILINNHDIREYLVSDLRSTFCVLMQDFSKYFLSLHDNIVLSDLRQCSDLEVLSQVISDAGLGEVIQKLPNKEFTLLGKAFGDGEELSGGEWQRIALARLFYRKASVYILDEPTKSIDFQTELNISERIRAVTKNKILIVVSHKNLDIWQSDKNIVLESGTIVERGSHSALIKKNGLYAKLYRVRNGNTQKQQQDISHETFLNSAVPAD